MTERASRDIVVLKFGGTSVSSLARWRTIEAVARRDLEGGCRPFLVCSAAAGISNLLEEALALAPRSAHDAPLAEIRRRHEVLAAELGVEAEALIGPVLGDVSRTLLGISLTGEVSPRLRARVMAAGELMSTRLGAAWLERRGLDVAWYDAREHLQAVPEPHAGEERSRLSATCAFDPDPVLRARVEREGGVVITQGFIASDPSGGTVLLGRGGSDTSAAYFAAKLQAARLDIWTDVPGLFTANPRQVPSARLLKRLGYLEAQELATTGAKVLHPRCIDPVRVHGIPLHIRNTEAPEMDGTVIADDPSDGAAEVKAIASRSGITLVSMDAMGMWQQVGFLADVFAIFKENGLSVDLVATSETNLTVSLDPLANALDPAVVGRLMQDLNGYCAAREIPGCAAVSLVGRNIRSILHALGPALETFEEHRVHMVSQAASDLNLSFVVDEDQAERLVRKLHAQFFADRIPDAQVGPSWRELTGAGRTPPSKPPWWRRRREALLEVAARDAPVFVYDPGTLDAAARRLRALPEVDRVFYALKANPNPDVLRRFEVLGLGFECVSQGEIEHVLRVFPGIDPDRILFTPNFAPADEYRFAFEAGVHVTIDSLWPFQAWGDLLQGRDVLVRVDPGRGRGHHPHVRTAGERSKFGVAPSDLPELASLAQRWGTRVVGLHVHVGSGIREPGTWGEAAVFLAGLLDAFPDVRTLDVGGGLGVVERPESTALDLDALGRALGRFRQAHPELGLWMEPGRYLVAEAGVLLARVTQVKRKGETWYVGLETGMNSLLRPALYGAFHEIVNLTRLDAPARATAEVVGPICETGDVLGHSRRLPETSPGDVLLVATAGAYGRAMSSHYNLRAPAGEIMLPAVARSTGR